MTTTPDHKPEAWFWEAGADDCPHGSEPDVDADGEAWDAWRERHPSSDNSPICLDAPAGDACGTCSEDDGEMVPWSACRAREHTRPKGGVAPNPDAEIAAMPAALPVPADRAGLRTGGRLDPGRKAAAARRAALETAIWDAGAGTVGQDDVDRIIAAVLPVLPPAADRAAVLREAADAVQAHPGAIPYRPQLDEDGGFWWDTRDRDAAANLLRRMADEAQYGDDAVMAASWRRDGFGEDEIADMLRRGGGEEQQAETQAPAPCGPTPDQCDAEAGEPCAAHDEGEHCFCGPECEGMEQQECDGCGHAPHPADQCQGFTFNERCECDEPVAVAATPPAVVAEPGKEN